jgi:hypothetical protein
MGRKEADGCALGHRSKFAIDSRSASISNRLFWGLASALLTEAKSWVLMTELCPA